MLWLLWILSQSVKIETLNILARWVWHATICDSTEFKTAKSFFALIREVLFPQKLDLLIRYAIAVYTR